jgi:hypothetical protein
MTRPHIIYCEDDCGNATDQVLAYVHPADPESARLVMDAEEGDNNGRSEYLWIRLQNGDLILGVYPKGDTYFTVEEDAQFQERGGRYEGQSWDENQSPGVAREACSDDLAAAMRRKVERGGSAIVGHPSTCGCYRCIVLRHPHLEEGGS